MVVQPLRLTGDPLHKAKSTVKIVKDKRLGDGVPAIYFTPTAQRLQSGVSFKSA